MTDILCYISFIMPLLYLLYIYDTPSNINIYPRSPTPNTPNNVYQLNLAEQKQLQTCQLFQKWFLQFMQKKLTKYFFARLITLLTRLYALLPHLQYKQIGNFVYDNTHTLVMLLLIQLKSLVLKTSTGPIQWTDCPKIKLIAVDCNPNSCCSLICMFCTKLAKKKRSPLLKRFKNGHLLFTRADLLRFYRRKTKRNSK